MNIEDVDPKTIDFKVGDWILHRDFGTSLVIRVLSLKEWDPRIEIFIFQWNRTIWFTPEQMIYEFIYALPSFEDIESLFSAKFYQYTDEEINARNKKWHEENKLRGPYE